MTRGSEDNDLYYFVTDIRSDGLLEAIPCRKTGDGINPTGSKSSFPVGEASVADGFHLSHAWKENIKICNSVFFARVDYSKNQSAIHRRCTAVRSFIRRTLTRKNANHSVRITMPADVVDIEIFGLCPEVQFRRVYMAEDLSQLDEVFGQRWDVLKVSSDSATFRAVTNVCLKFDPRLFNIIMDTKVATIHGNGSAAAYREIVKNSLI